MSAVQVIRFPKGYWSLAEAGQWVFSHGFAPIKISSEGRRWNFRLVDPAEFDHFASKIITSRATGKPIHLVFGFRLPREEQDF